MAFLRAAEAHTHCRLRLDLSDAAVVLTSDAAQSRNLSSDCIRVVAAENTPDNRVSAGERYARIYEINLSRCIFCGYCELACPFDAITLGNEYELSEYSRDDLIYTKDMLLEQPIKRSPIADPDLYDTPIPAYKSSS